MWAELFTQFFKALVSGFDMGKALAPTDKMKEERLARVTPRLTADEYAKELRKLRGHLFWFPKQSVDAAVNLYCDGFDADDIKDLRTALYELLPEKRHHIKPENAKG